ncbi:major histocompatibility complex class I-related gene protein-like isoform X2 [Sceloporus undulatus]|uniref:major histocompatibility complex class I-related gene protein-like isoform X2 n=1 Tax=Sceloporus undulatus TaxID=8520 RepID=UPI001C4D6068|nr:major histocompatibility complex class I-related gene protein-like isoform X2 [Sceloporus undulatus]
MGRLLCLLGVTALFLIGASGDALPPGPSPQAANGGSSHVLRYYATSVLEPGQQVPHFASVGYVNDQQIVYYDIETKRRRPKNDWITKSVEHDPQYWEWTTQRVQNAEQWFRAVLVNVPKYFNQTGGLHTWQEMVCCELRKDGSKGGYWQYAYDGEDYISLDKETLTWTAASLPAQNTKRKWDPNTAFNQFTKNYLEEECIEWLRRYLEYGKKALLRTALHDLSLLTSTSTGLTPCFRQHSGYSGSLSTCPKTCSSVWNKGSRRARWFRNGGFKVSLQEAVSTLSLYT